MYEWETDHVDLDMVILDAFFTRHSHQFLFARVISLQFNELIYSCFRTGLDHVKTLGSICREVEMTSITQLQINQFTYQPYLKAAFWMEN